MSALRSQKDRYSRDRPAHPVLGALVIVAVAGLLMFGVANAIDGNYSSPYASQWDTRSAGASIPDETFLGMLLLMVNICLAAFFVLRDRLRRRRRAV